MDRARVFRFLAERLAGGSPCVLVTVGAVEGSSMREPGTVMGVAADGSFAGSLSGGCIENAVVAEALEALNAGSPRVVRFGAGSPYLDIKLPCGGGLDVHFQPLGDSKLAEDCLKAKRERRPFSIRLADQGARCEAGWTQTRFDPQTGEGVFGHWPAPRLAIIGHGAGVEALSNLAREMHCPVHVLTPDERIAEGLKTRDVPVGFLSRTTQTDLLESDPWTAFVFLFHDHDWEVDLMASALDLHHFYIGAMGGRKAHAQRLEALRARGVKEEKLATIRAPIGLFHSSRDPHTLALSTLAQVVRAYQDTDFEAARG